MVSVEYKILFEIRFLHDYYLYGEEPDSGNRIKSFFAMNSNNQSTRLTELVKSGRYDMRKDLELLVSPDDQRLFKSLRMKLVSTEIGFFLVIEVKRIVSRTGDVRFEPVIKPAEDAYLVFGLAVKNPLFGAISNLRLDDEGKIYYFSNEEEHHKFSLSSPIKPISPGQQYRMGDLARVAGGVKQATADNNGNASFWSAVSSDGVVHQGDRSLNPHEDWYRKWRDNIKIRSKHPAGVIKIFLINGNSELSPINENRLLTTRFLPTIKKAKHPIYELRWLTRSTYWRYRKRGIFSEEEKSDIVNNAGSLLVAREDAVLTTKPLPITRERLQGLWVGSSVNLPNAQPGIIKKEGAKIFSDIELNELNPFPKDV